MTGRGRPVVDTVRASAYTIPTDAPEADGTLAWDSTTLVLVQAWSGDVVGTGWTYGPAACAAVVSDLLADIAGGRDVHAVPDTWSAMVRAVRNAGRPGIAGMALSAVDCALWDLSARILGLPLHRLLGAGPEAEVDVYGSGGFTTYDDARATEQLVGWARDERIPRVKIKIGESWGTAVDRDLARVALAREVVGPDVELYVDANGAYSPGQAVRVERDLRAHDVGWFEEPVSSDHLASLAVVRAASRADVTAGEYGYDLAYFQRMCASGAVDCLQVDVTRCGGLTELRRVAAVAAAHGLEISGHCAPHLHVAALAAVENTRHLEWFHDHVRIETMLFDGTLDPSGGSVSPRGEPGHGLTWRAEAAEVYRVGAA